MREDAQVHRVETNRKGRDSVQILVAEDSLKTQKSVATGFLDLFGVDENPFAAAGYSVPIASAVMVKVTLPTRPMPEEFVNGIFGERRGLGRAQAPAYSRTSAHDPEGSGGTSS